MIFFLVTHENISNNSVSLNWWHGNTNPESRACIDTGWASSDNCLLFRAYRKYGEAV